VRLLYNLKIDLNLGYRKRSIFVQLENKSKFRIQKVLQLYNGDRFGTELLNFQHSVVYNLQHAEISDFYI
jgi:hypothetical protein